LTGDLKLVRTLDDLVRTVSSIAIHFKTDRVLIIGSQSILLSWPDAPIILRTSREIDAYPGNARLWEITEKSRDPTFDAEASEEIAALFGVGSAFHAQFGFYIDGVDENTSRLPDGWRDRAIEQVVKLQDRDVVAIAPCPEDLIVSKLATCPARR
jgi:hypothetical protein